jgi:serine/threonine protein kinase/Tol biopolymer transport system component
VKAERWQEVKHMLFAALEKAPADRTAYLDSACTDPSLRREVESLILSHEQGGSSFMEQPPAGLPGDDALKSGSRIGGYEILTRIGAGGMGVVYSARDTLLGRTVAIKVLPNAFLNDPERLARFQREARVLASLNHPNISTVHGLEQSGSMRALVMEMVDGPTLADRIRHGPIPIDEALRIAKQICEALEYAHERGVVHRDLKPANVKVTSDDAVKVLDFGLAKAIQGDGSETDPANSPTISEMATQAGMLLGTAAYMSPEQAKGKAVDRRADIWAFGCVLYEMLTAKMAFRGDSVTDTLASVIRTEPDWTPLPPATPQQVRVLLRRCLQKEARQRLQAIGDARIALDEFLSGVPEAALAGAPPTIGSRWRRALPWTLGGVATVAALVLLLILIAIVDGPSPVSRSLVWKQITFSTDHKEGAILTDGTRLYFHSQDGPVEMSVNGGATAPVRASFPGMGIVGISPDGSEMLALRRDPNDETFRGSLWSVPVLGGYPRMLGTQTARGAGWSADGRRMVYAELNSVFVGDGDGSNVRKVWGAPGEVDAACFSPDSRLIAATVVEGAKGAKIWELNSDGGSPHRLDLDWPEDADQSDGQWTPDGKHFVFLSGSHGQHNIYEVIRPPWFALWKKSFAVRLTEGQINVLAATPSRDSTGLFVVGEIAQGAMQAWDPAQKKFVPFLGGLAATKFVVSPDKKWMVYVDYPQHHLWRSRLDGSERFQLTDSYSIMPQWSPDSKKIVYSDWNQIYVISADGGTPEKLIPNPNQDVLPNWSPDGKSIAFSDYPLPGQFIGIKVLDLATRKIFNMPGSQGFVGPAWSPDGKYMVAWAYNPTRVVLYSARTGIWKVLRVSDRPSGNWVWSNDSQSLYFDMPDAGREQVRGFYRLAIADGAWSRIGGYDPLAVIGDPGQGVFPSITSEGQPAIMIDTSVDQIYLAKWN